MTTKMILSIAMIVGAFSLLLLTTCSASKAPRGFDNSTVTSLDLTRYTGRWYEIVRKPHFFEKGMSHVTATYTLLPDGKIEVLNEGIKSGKPKRIKGKARTTDNPGTLKVTFFVFPSEYNILELGPDYSYAVVGGSKPSYLWVLSRTPHMEPKVLEGIYERLRARGYDLSDLIVVEQ